MQLRNACFFFLLSPKAAPLSCFDRAGTAAFFVRAKLTLGGKRPLVNSVFLVHLRNKRRVPGVLPSILKRGLKSNLFERGMGVFARAAQGVEEGGSRAWPRCPQMAHRKCRKAGTGGEGAARFSSNQKIHSSQGHRVSQRGRYCAALSFTERFYRNYLSGICARQGETSFG